MIGSIHLSRGQGLVGTAMKDLRKASFFAPINGVIEEAVTFLQSKPLMLMTTADLHSILALGFLESALLDRGISYSRRILPPNSHIPPDEKNLIPEQDGSSILFVDPWARIDSSLPNVMILSAQPVEVEFSHSSTKRRGRIDVVLQSSAIASSLSPNGTRSKRCRPYSGCGQWLMESLDTTIDPIHTLIRDFLRDEGSIQISALPEVENPSVEMIPLASQRRLQRLKKLWDGMDASARAQALSEYSLPLLSSPGISTARLEELIWKRMLIPNQSTDLASILFQIMKEWPSESDSAILHAGRMLDELLKTGQLLPSTD
ncbi:MAG: hypothetical protein CMA18_002995 [Methanobacteriota archaeon]|nr:MAG: hypothetical protein CBC63_06725 [Euryarchaeota archaeon TMED103]RAH11682.1 MAG: hypothetical protein CMA18_002995 [Euryarchaeota archaeon]